MNSEQQLSFNKLKNNILKPYAEGCSIPKCTVRNDQIVWGRCPVRLDFAGGWSDTPPYCLDYGGRVLNIAVNLNNQPPIQVYARRIDSLELIIRSIDLGRAECIRSYEDIKAYNQVGSGFALAKGAFALAGFDPDFNNNAYDNLSKQLKDLGGGIELTMMAAVPKGSGLGVSSILAATILGVLSDFCDYKWDQQEIVLRALALEQMLTTGGGWQDQAGGVLPGVKLLKTEPGHLQIPSTTNLSDRFFTGDYKKKSLLYYTGITRVAKNILGEIVKSMFQENKETLDLINMISDNAIYGSKAIASKSFNDFIECINKSWELNRLLDVGTCPPQVNNILDTISNHVSAAKLLGAGGGGYMYIIANDEVAAMHIKDLLETSPPNNLARFVDFTVSKRGLTITRS